MIWDKLMDVIRQKAIVNNSAIEIMGGIEGEQIIYKNLDPHLLLMDVEIR